MDRILVVDDEMDICVILKFNLENNGYAVDVANSGKEALEMPLAEYSLLLLDVMMDDMSGFALAARIRDRPAENTKNSSKISRRLASSASSREVG